MGSVIATGFTSFGKHDQNPTEHAIKYCQEKIDPEYFQGIVLPTSYQSSWEELKQELTKRRPDFLLMFGLAHKAQAYMFEKVAINFMDATIADNDGVKHSGVPVQPGAPDGLFATLDLESFRASCGGGLSLSAGSYVCNSLFYNSLNFLSDTKTKAAFIHVPASREMDSDSIYSQQEINQFVEKVINFAIRQ